MAEELHIGLELNKEQKYIQLLPQIQSLTEGEHNQVANLANISAALMQTFGFWWVGFYLVEGDELVLGPFQGPIACTRIQYGKGVCGTAFAQKKTVLVPDVDQFPGHIACSSASRSEIVVPVIKNEQVLMVIDVDSAKLNDFDAIDQLYLEKLAEMIARKA
ncbi:GAF domain-containing protein [Catalinimonas niigatensis]|uniref:GAF domain-containing protein n=1 Tax=Catalinimonas niigatensis TaxID=1397264 RepID=UPI002666C256|nr:GAF domain-containing protein [Catalinimonas niigatensis]WPP50515.1 GAF domain-containing protein [Catalinimonas niigatensis]